MDYDFPFSWECHNPKWCSYVSEGFKPPTMVVFDKKWGLKLGFTLEFVTAQKMLKGTFAKPTPYFAVNSVRCQICRTKSIHWRIYFATHHFFCNIYIYIYIFNFLKIPTLALLNSSGAAPPQNWAPASPKLRSRMWLPRTTKSALGAWRLGRFGRGGADLSEKKRGNNQWFLNLLCCVLGRWFEMSLSFCFENQTFSSSKLQFSHWSMGHYYPLLYFWTHLNLTTIFSCTEF